ncbi:hypothetical protein EV690_0113 [Celerinatantimonas diazotrophica]|uniref:Uncharacterized protein n=2 Tax=Celerinatantimonas diazotrophica TaxID=412034 RepID=A0A4R1KIL3_9GAMM|nr:hypothetical protein EV690_0113 [Celerinatantimonas diazotrophica]CAG9297084.1 hypothetical protein CEDIAZO_02246 [Celerinatantimonas diazotrophica]
MLAGKAISLLFGNTLDKSRLARLSLNCKIRQGGHTVAWAAKQWERLSGEVASSTPDGRGELSDAHRCVIGTGGIPPMKVQAKQG